MKLETVLVSWRLWQESQTLSERTITERAGVITHLLAYTGADPLTITPDNIIRFGARPGLSATTRGTYHASIRAYCTWLIRTDQRDDDPSMKTPRPRRPKGLPRPVPDSSLSALLDKVSRRRTRMMILLAALAGLRVHEIAKIRGEDVDIFNGLLHVTGKGNKTATIPLHPSIAEEAATFPAVGFWFPSYSKQPGLSPHIRPPAVSSAIMSTMKRAGVPGQAHQLRHWYATSLLKAGVDLRIVQELMRHASPATTAIYTRVDISQQVAGLARLHLPVREMRKAG